MNILLRFLVVVFVAGELFAQDVNKSIQAVANDLGNHSVTKEHSRMLRTQLTQDELTRRLLEALWNADSISVEDASKLLLFEMDPFPFEQINEVLNTTDSSQKQAYLLSILNRGAKKPEQITATLKIAKSMLGNKGKGIRRYGEARAYSSDGPRVCDVAYNILVTRLSLVPSMPRVDVDNFGVDERDALIVKLAKREAIRTKADVRINHKVPPGEDRSSPNVPRSSPAEKVLEAKPPVQDKVEISSIFWLLAAVLAIATTILLWLMRTRNIKKSSNRGKQ